MTTPKEQAIKEIEEENFKLEVEKEKQNIRKIIKNYRWWHKFVPFTVSIKFKRRESWK